MQVIRLRLAEPHNRKRSLLKRTIIKSREFQPEYPFKRTISDSCPKTLFADEVAVVFTLGWLVPFDLVVTATVLQELWILKPGLGEQAEDPDVASEEIHKKIAKKSTFVWHRPVVAEARHGCGQSRTEGFCSSSVRP